MSNELLTPGKFVIGCNYWASHAGTAMWSDWRPETVERDLKQLHEAGLQVLRVFPIWPDFQPLTILSPGAGQPPVFAHGERPLSEEEMLHGGVSETMMDRFGQFVAIAERNELRLIVGLVTGWMSGRLFLPQPFIRLNALTDPMVMQWQARFVREMVRRFRDRRGIAAWDLGNECNCMASVTRAEAWRWVSMIVNAIRAEDATRPVVSGMHSLSPAPTKSWLIQDQAELTDLLTDHPYPIFTPHCDMDPINTPRTVLHAVAEARFYADIGRKPCLIEEFGTLGPAFADDKTAAQFLRSVLFSGWAHDCHGALWWCGFEQSHLAQTPYSWCAIERELGLFRLDGTPKPVLAEMSDFAHFLRRLPVGELPPRITEAVCILSADQDQWGAAYSSFVLAKQAGFDLTFQYQDQAMRETQLYLLPCVTGSRVIERGNWLELLERVHRGATLYVSLDGGLLSPFTEPFGVSVLGRVRRIGEMKMTVDGMADAPALHMGSTWQFLLRPRGARVVGSELDGNPVLTVADYGKGHIWCLTAPLETTLANEPAAFHGDRMQEFWQIYRRVAEPWIQQRIVRKSQPNLGITEHPLDGHSRVIVMQNYAPEPASGNLELAPGWKIGEVWRGPQTLAQDASRAYVLGPNDAFVFTVARRAT